MSTNLISMKANNKDKNVIISGKTELLEMRKKSIKNIKLRQTKWHRVAF